mgnify:CR=1 FL=1
MNFSSDFTKHNDYYYSKCENCQINLCSTCQKYHNKNHKITQFIDIQPDIYKLKTNYNIFQSLVDDLCKAVMELKTKLRF